MRSNVNINIAFTPNKNSGQSAMNAFFCCLLQTVARPAQAAAWVRALACALLLGGVTAMPMALAAPPLYLCPGNLFSNHLDPSQARAMGCRLATPGRMSQAHDPQTTLASPDGWAGSTGTASPTGPISEASDDGKTGSRATANGALPAQSNKASDAPPVANAAPVPPPARKPSQTVADAAQQRARDSDAKEILRSELARTQAQLQALMQQAPSGPETDSALQRLRADEAALRRELARLPG